MTLIFTDRRNNIFLATGAIFDWFSLQDGRQLGQESLAQSKKMHFGRYVHG